MGSKDHIARVGHEGPGELTHEDLLLINLWYSYQHSLQRAAGIFPKVLEGSWHHWHILPLGFVL